MPRRNKDYDQEFVPPDMPGQEEIGEEIMAEAERLRHRYKASCVSIIVAAKDPNTGEDFWQFKEAGCGHASASVLMRLVMDMGMTLSTRPEAEAIQEDEDGGD